MTATSVEGFLHLLAQKPLTVADSIASSKATRDTEAALHTWLHRELLPALISKCHPAVVSYA